MYHIFRVYDYKGGKQSCDLNLTKAEAITSLIEAYCVDEIIVDEIIVDEEPTIESLSKLVSDAIDENSSLYAGGDGVVLSIFKTTANSLKLKELYVEDFIPDMAKMVLDEGWYEVENAD